MLKTPCALAGIIMLIATCASAQPGGSPASAEKFMRDFVAWYSRLAAKQSAKPAWRIALESRNDSFAPALAHLLKADADAQAKCRDLIGLDFDPFLNSQDPAEHYATGRVTQNGRRFSAAIFAVEHGVRNAKPDATAEFTEDSGRYQFVDFRYPDGTDLLGVLKSPRPQCPRSARMR